MYIIGQFYIFLLAAVYCGNAEPRIVMGLDDLRPFNTSTCTGKVLKENRKLSTPAECARTCRKGEKPKMCYYEFTFEAYPTFGRACELCNTTATSHFCPDCQCVQADGVQRIAFVTNRMLPGPSIEVCEGDSVIIDVHNQMPGTEVAIHWHGILQQGSQYYDGVPMVTQCPIPEATSFRYQWQANNAGTHFWHSHDGLQKMDGIFGSIVVRQAEGIDPGDCLYDYDLSRHVIIVNDWMHNFATERFPGLRNATITQEPESILINGKGRYRDPKSKNITNTKFHEIEVEQNKRYRFRYINSFCSTCTAILTIQDHNITIIATDGVPVVPVNVTSILSYSGERYDFVLNANKPIGSYWIQVDGGGPCSGDNITQYAILRYKNSRKNLQSSFKSEPLPQGFLLNPTDGLCREKRSDAICVSQLKSAVPIDKTILKQKPDLKLYMPFRFLRWGNELYKPNTYYKYTLPAGNEISVLIDGLKFVFPPSPPLSQLHDIPQNMFCNETHIPKGCEHPCTCTHMINIPLHAIVEVILVDEIGIPGLSHPFHLHGYAFHVIGMGTAPGNDTSKMTVKKAIQMDKDHLMRRRFDLPPAKDTLNVPTNGYSVMRFQASNPGFWLYHCHFIYHNELGMKFMFHVGEQSDLPPVPKNFPKCGNFLPKIISNCSRKRRPTNVKNSPAGAL